jgi:hypothetical protein
MTGKSAVNPKSYNEAFWGLHFRGSFPYQRSKSYWAAILVLVVGYLAVGLPYFLQHYQQGFFLGYVVPICIPVILTQVTDYLFYRASKH